MGNKDKGTLTAAGHSLIERVIERVRPQVDEIYISCRNRESYQKLDCKLIGDEPFPSEGPLCGIAAGLKQISCDKLLIVPCDAPEVPANLVNLLEEAMNKKQKPLACIKTGDRIQPLFSMVSKELEAVLAESVLKGERKVVDWMQQQNALAVEDERSELYLNLNTPEDLIQYEKQVRTKS
jgi:molybdopterin-guanine dinucleotide biosynthesis protein A